MVVLIWFDLLLTYNIAFDYEKESNQLFSIFKQTKNFKSPKMLIDNQNFKIIIVNESNT